MTLRRMLGRISTPQRFAAGAVVVVLLGAGFGLWLLPRQTVSPPVSTSTPVASPTPSPTPSATPRPTPTPAPTATPAPDRDDVNVTVLLIGRDRLAERTAAGQSGMNTDMLIVANIHADGSRIDLISLPRDSVDVPLGDGTLWRGKINSLRAARGLPALKQAMSAALAIPIDYYAEMTLDDLARIVNAVGGVTVNLAAPLNDGHLGISWRAGANVLDGRTAILFARSRYSDSDYARAARNQLLLIALRDKLLGGGYDPLALLTSLPGLATDIPAADMPMLLELVRRSAGAPIVRKVLAPPEFTLFTGIAGARGWVSVPNLEAIRAYAASVFSHP
jgi:LCP family protein required for cell wall assembly